MTGSKRRSRLLAFAAAATLAAATFAAGCQNIDVITGSYSSVAEAKEAGAIEKGWVPAGIPANASDIREAHDLDTTRRWGLFSFPSSDADAMRAMLQPDELSVANLQCDIPARIEWWPRLLRGRLEAEPIKTTGLKVYPSREGNLVVVVNWAQGRAYYWSR